MPDRFTEVSNTSFLGNISNSIMGALFGILLFVFAFPLEAWNEKRAVDMTRALDEGGKTVISAKADSVNMVNEGMLIYVTGTAAAGEVLKDPSFAVSKEAIRLCRDVRMYQWKESKSSEDRKRLGGGSQTVTTYSYDKDWCIDPIRWQEFRHPEGHQNPGDFPYSRKVFTASNVNLGVFRLDNNVIDLLNNYADLSVDECPDRVDGRKATVLSDKEIYLGVSPDRPKVGDLKVSYRYLPTGPVSVIGRQANNMIQPYRTRNGQTIMLARCGTIPSKEMFKEAESENQQFTWILRGVGFIMMWFGICLIGKPLSAIGSVIPLLGGLLEAGIITLGFVIALMASAITVAVAWMAVRPLLGIGIIVGGLVFAAVIISLRRK
jgi:hypothetical protein